MNSESIQKAKQRFHLFRSGSKPLWLGVLLPGLLALSGCNFPRVDIQATSDYLFLQQTQVAASIATPPLDLVQPVQTIMPTPLFEYNQATPLPLETPLPVEPTPTGSCQLELEPGKQLYCSQSGDRLSVIAAHFRVSPDQIQGSKGLDPKAILPVNTPLGLPKPTFGSTYSQPGFPDNEVLYSQDSAASNISAYVEQSQGYLKQYGEYLYGGWYSGAEIIELVALETSTNPRLLLSLVEFQSNWLYGYPEDAEEDISPLNYDAVGVEGLYAELQVAARELSRGFYGWREGTLQNLTFRDETTTAISPGLNPGTVAVQYLFAGLYTPASFAEKLYGPNGYLAFHSILFGDAWVRVASFGSVMPAGLSQPTLSLPFPIGETWALTSGPHITWQYGTPRGALDFAPLDDLPGCIISPNWAVASAPGLVVRSDRGAVAIDLDGDGNEGTGWVLIYMHITPDERVSVGTWLNQDGLVGHPSCEGGYATGTHLHLARKYNGEWIHAEGPLPFILDGWQAVVGPPNYGGRLVRDGQEVLVGPSSKEYTWIWR
jgi:murein DD-endopeptidase MepM/ murein hydrolase activator NlpD